MASCTAYPRLFKRFVRPGVDYSSEELPECTGVCEPYENECYNIVNPCEDAECPGHPDAVCKLYSCDLCLHYFVDSSGKRINGCGACADV